MTRTFQSKADQAMAEFEENLFKPGQLFAGFDNLAKAMDPSLCERRELALGGLDDKELAGEISLLNSYLREERQMYERDTHFHNILEAARQRILHLSGMIQRMGKEVVETGEDKTYPNKQVIGRMLREPVLEPLLITTDDLVRQRANGIPDDAGFRIAPEATDLGGRQKSLGDESYTSPMDDGVRGEEGYPERNIYPIPVPDTDPRFRQSGEVEYKAISTAGDRGEAVPVWPDETPALFIPADGAPIKEAPKGE